MLVGVKKSIKNIVFVLFTQFKNDYYIIRKKHLIVIIRFDV